MPEEMGGAAIELRAGASEHFGGEVECDDGIGPGVEDCRGMTACPTSDIQDAAAREPTEQGVDRGSFKGGERIAIVIVQRSPCRVAFLDG